MFRNYIKTALRSFLNHKFFSLINLFGLSLGLGVAILIALYISSELSYDKFHTRGDQIYRVLRIGDINDNEYLIGVTSGPYGPALKNDFPESIKEVVRVRPGEALVSYDDRSFLEKKFFLADKNFFEIFSFPLTVGDPAHVLANPNSIVITQEMAHKYFGNSDPIGQSLRVDDQFDFIISGVAPKPRNSHLEFDFVASLGAIENFEWFQEWWNNGLFTYVLIDTPEEAEKVESQLPAFIDKYLGDDFRKSGRRVDPTLQPLSDIYFQRETRYDPALHGDKDAVYSFALIALFILVIACINYMNLATARAGRRAKEIGVRKVLGAAKMKLIFQFFSESLLMTILAMTVAAGSVELFLPYFNSTFEFDLSVTFLDPQVLLTGSVLVLIVSLLASCYPAFLLSSFQPASALKSQSEQRLRGVSLRQCLVVFQFCISIFLIISTFLIGQQLKYLRTKDLGFNNEHVVLVPMNNRDIFQRRNDFTGRLRREGGVIEVSSMSGQPGGFHDTMAFGVEGKDQNWRFRTVFADYDYVKTLGLRIVAGRDFSRDFGTDINQAVLLNETAVRNLGWTSEQAIDKEMYNVLSDTVKSRVVGVVADYHFSSLKDAIEPLIISMHPRQRMFAIRVTASGIQKTLTIIEDHWRALSPGFPMEFSFLDETFYKLYRQEQRESELFRIFAFIANSIACLGLLGLAAFSSEQRTKEIGIRKVLGASIPNVLFMLSKDFVKLVLIANLIAWPVAWYLMRGWLQGFAYRIDISWWTFCLAGTIALIVAMFTVSAQAIKAALANPVTSLKYE